MSKSKTVFAGNPNSQYDPGLISKEVHDFFGQANRVLDARSLSRFYTHFRATYNADSLPSEVYYYRGTEAHKTQVGAVSDVSGSLNNKYFFIYSSPDGKKYHVWFNVDGAGVDPAPADSTGIEIAIVSNDPSTVVAAAITLTLNSLFGDTFYAVRTQSVVEIATTGLGETTNSSDFNTTFSIANIAGKQEEVACLVIPYEGLDPIYNGEVLKNYRFNIFDAKFEANQGNITISDGDGDSLEINADGSINTVTQNGSLESTQQLVKTELESIDTKLDFNTELTSGVINTNGQTVIADCDGKALVLLQVGGAFVGTIAFEASIDNGTTWVALIGHVNGVMAASGQVTTPNLVYLRAAGFNRIRVRSTAWTSGTASILFSATPHEGVQSSWQFGTWSVRNQDGFGNVLGSNFGSPTAALRTASLIGDAAGDQLNINPDGSINVVTSATGNILSNYYNEVSGVVSGVTTLVASYTAGVNELLQKVEFSGTNIAEFELRINGVIQAKKRTYFGNSLDGAFDFNNGISVPSGQKVDVYVIHNRPMTGDFNARIQILET